METLTIEEKIENIRMSARKAMGQILKESVDSLFLMLKLEIPILEIIESDRGELYPGEFKMGAYKVNDNEYDIDEIFTFNIRCRFKKKDDQLEYRIFSSIRSESKTGLNGKVFTSWDQVGTFALSIAEEVII
jgi:hypothetical protein